MAKKKFARRADQFEPLAENRGGCFATDMITVEGRKVGYMYRDEPRNKQDSGWVFTAGDESQAYMDNADNHGIYDIRYSYRLRDENEDGPVESLYGFVLNDDGHLEMAIYFDHPADEAEALQLVESVAERKCMGPT